jgi:uncharacterized membrane protein (UPF0182 family)
MIDNNYKLDRYCDEIGTGLAYEIAESGGDEDELQERVRQYVDECEHVIYTHRAEVICSSCNVDQGQRFLDDIGGISLSVSPAVWRHLPICSRIAFGEIYSRAIDIAQEKLCELREMHFCNEE